MNNTEGEIKFDEKGRRVWEKRTNTVKPSALRRFVDHQGHASPRGTDRRWGWWGTSRVKDKAAKRRANKRSWTKMKEQAAREGQAKRIAQRQQHSEHSERVESDG